jgi:oxygen-independent coproporphyrinogen-3 oxidase
MERYVERLSAEIASARSLAARLQVELPGRIDSIYFGGGTPSLLSADQVTQLFSALRDEFEIVSDAEVTVECAPGQLTEATLDELLRQGMNRVSLGVQSFVDAEARAVGRLHTRSICLGEIERMRAAGIDEINVDLIAGLPRQTRTSWRESAEVALASGVPHLSLYMLEIDEDSRLGREMLAHGNRYGAGEVPSEDETAEWYCEACEWLATGGVNQYEISNFARKRTGTESIGAGKCSPDHRSRHNVKYWHRDPYLGFGLDAHSMLRRAPGDGRNSDAEALRWANESELDPYLEQEATPMSVPAVEQVSRERAFEEAMFLGLRMNEGVDLEALREEFGEDLMRTALVAIDEVEEAGLLLREASRIRLTARGRMASNEVFSRLLVADPQLAPPSPTHLSAERRA